MVILPAVSARVDGKVKSASLDPAAVMDIQSELSAATLPPLLELIRFASDLLLTYKYVPRRSDRPLQNAADTYAFFVSYRT